MSCHDTHKYYSGISLQNSKIYWSEFIYSSLVLRLCLIFCDVVNDHFQNVKSEFKSSPYHSHHSMLWLRTHFMQHSSVRGSLGRGKGDAKAVKWMAKTWEIAVARHLSQHTGTIGYMSNWKHAPMMETTSPKPARMRSDKRKRKQSGENESVRQMNTSGGWRVGGGRGYRVKLDIEFSIFPWRFGWS